MTAFRISVCLSKFFSDQRSLSYILIDNRFQTISDLEDYIKFTFNLQVEFNICLVSSNHLLPSTEDIQILSKDDKIIVSAVTEDFIIRKAKVGCINESTKQKKRKSSRRSTEQFVLDDESSNEREVVKIESENSDSSKRKKKKNKNNNYAAITLENEINELCKVESENRTGLEEDNLHISENKTVHILNVENISSMTLNNDMSVDQKDNYTSNESLHSNLLTNPLFNNSKVNSLVMSSNEDENEIPSCRTKIDHNTDFKNSFSENSSIPSNVNSRLSKKSPCFTVGNFINYAQKIAEEKARENKNCLFITKRRHRIRKRKSRPPKEVLNFINSYNNIDSLVEPAKIKTNPALHIRFSDDDIDNNANNNNNDSLKSILKNGTNDGSSSGKLSSLFNPVSILKKVDANCQVNKENDQNEPSFTNAMLLQKHLDFFKNIDLTKNLPNIKYTILISEIGPKENDIIAFKMYEMSENYEPTVSSWIIAKVLKWHSESRSLDLIILAGRIQSGPPEGKFNLDSEDFISNQNCSNSYKKHSSLVHLNLKSLIDPRVLLLES